MLCGNSYDQHLATWWFPQLYSPYDLHLDRVFQSATANSSSQNNDERKRKQKNISSSSKRNPNVKKRKIIDKQHENEEEKEPPDMKPMLHGSFKHFPVLNYHKAYVRLVDEDDDMSERQPSKVNTNRKLQPKPRHVKKEHTPNVQYRTRTSIDGIKYKYRGAKIPEKYKGEKELLFLLLVARRMVLDHVEDLLFLEQKENSFYERKRWNPFW